MTRSMLVMYPHNIPITHSIVLSVRKMRIICIPNTNSTVDAQLFLQIKNKDHVFFEKNTCIVNNSTNMF